MWRALRISRQSIAAACFIAVVALSCSACNHVTTSPKPPSSSVPHTSGPLKAPKTSVIQDGQFFTEVTEADSTLATYERQQGNVALRALLTDGSAFCSLLKSGDGLDDALVNLAVGARGVETQTHLPLSVTTFNTIESVALLTLCPSDLKLMPAADQVKIRALGVALAGRAG